MWRELVQPKDRVTRLVLHTVLDNKSMATVLGRPLGATQAERIMAAGLDDMEVTGLADTQATLPGDDAAAEDEAPAAAAVASASDTGAGGDERDLDDDVPMRETLNEAFAAVASRLYDQVMTCALRILAEVDLGLTRKAGVVSEGLDADISASEEVAEVVDGAVLSSADAEHFQPRVAKDFTLFLNLVDFLTYFMSLCPHELFRPWAYVFFKQVITGSNKYPNVSGFYKLLTVGVFVADDIGALHVGPPAVVTLAAGSAEDLSQAAVAAQNAEYSTKLVAKFAEEVCALWLLSSD